MCRRRTSNKAQIIKITKYQPSAWSYKRKEQAAAATQARRNKTNSTNKATKAEQGHNTKEQVAI